MCLELCNALELCLDPPLLPEAVLIQAGPAALEPIIRHACADACVALIALAHHEGVWHPRRDRSQLAIDNSLAHAPCRSVMALS